MTKVGVLAHSKKSLGGGLAQLRASLTKRGVVEPSWYEFPKSRLLPRYAKKLIREGVDTVLVWGGDGSVQRAIDAFADADVTMGVIPAGTANLFAGNLDIPNDLEAALDIALDGEVRHLDAGEINGERFGVMAGAGLDALMIHEADRNLKDTFGRVAYVWTGATATRRDPFKVKVEVDGRLRFKGLASCVLVANLRDVMGGISALPDARPDDGRLDLGIVTADGAVEWLRTLGRAAFGDVDRSPFVKTTSGERFDVRFKKPQRWELDGGSRPKVERLKVKVHPKAISIRGPVRAASGVAG
jgi:YegS/Rv2252/BmrU family lipid kinase